MCLDARLLPHKLVNINMIQNDQIFQNSVLNLTEKKNMCGALMYRIRYFSPPSYNLHFHQQKFQLIKIYKLLSLSAYNLHIQLQNYDTHYRVEEYLFSYYYYFNHGPGGSIKFQPVHGYSNHEPVGSIYFQPYHGQIFKLTMNRWEVYNSNWSLVLHFN